MGQTVPDIRLVRLSQGSSYALSGMIFLARHAGEGMLMVEEVARKQGLPKSFLAKIFQGLAHRGLLVSRRGQGGGYALARAPKEIPLARIVEAVEEPPPSDRKCLLELRHCGEGEPCAMHEAVLKTEEIMRTALEKMTLADCLETEPGKGTSGEKRKEVG